MFLLYIKFLSFYFYGILSTLHVIFSKKSYETINIGNNNLNKTLEEVEDYILNINQAISYIHIQANKYLSGHKYIQANSLNILSR